MPEPDSWRAFLARRRWRRPVCSAQQLRLLGLFMLTLAAAVQLYVFGRNTRTELVEAFKTIGQATVWRSANYSYSKNLADFVIFLHRHIPEEAEVFWPPQDSGSRLPGATTLQVLLYPRRLMQCPPTGCRGISLDEQTFFITAGDYPGSEILGQAVEQQAFNERWGVVTFDPAGFGDYEPPAQFGSLRQAATSAVLPVLWLLLLALGGGLMAARMLPGGGFYMNAALGYGLGSGLFSILAGLAALSSFDLRAPVLVGITLMILAGGVLLRSMGQQNERAAQQRARGVRFGFLMGGWALVMLGLGAISALVAVGKGYHVSDELLIWAPKGYGIAGSGSIENVTEWGTNTLPYPLLVPILIASSNLLFGDILPAAKLLFSAYYLALLFLSYSFLVETGLKPYAAGCCSLLAATAPLIFRHSTIAYANLPFTLNLAAAVLCLTQAGEGPVQAGSKPAYLLSGLFFMLAAWTRPEGAWMAWLLIAGMAALQAVRVKRPNWRIWLWAAAPMLFYQVFWWLVSRHAYFEGVERSQIGMRAIEEILSGNLHLYEGLFILGSGISRLLKFETWGLWGIGTLLLAAGGFLLLVRGRGAKRQVFIAGWLIFVLVLVMYYVASFDKRHDVSWWVSTGLERMLFPGLMLLWLGGLQLLSAGRMEGSHGEEVMPDLATTQLGEDKAG